MKNLSKDQDDMRSEEENQVPESNKIEALLLQIEEQKKEISLAKQESEQNYNLYARAMAEAENARKRIIKDFEHTKRYALEGIFKDILPVLDGFDNAFSSQNLDKESAAKSLQEGILLVKKQLHEVLEKNGLQPLPAQGKKFDPNIHQAIKRTESSDIDEETVEHEFAKGYKIYDKLLRPSIVSVLSPAAPDKDSF